MSSPSTILTALAATLIAGCPHPGGLEQAASEPPAPLTAEGDGWSLALRELAPGVWLHTTWRELPHVGPFPANGLLVREGDGLLMVDTAWGEAPTEQLLAWAELELGLPVVGALATHRHDDCYGGAPALGRRGIPTHFHPQDLAQPLAPGEDLTGLLEPLYERDRLAWGGLELFHPGAGHSRGNLTVYLPEQGILFGGCAVRATDAQGLGNTEHATIDSWAVAMQRLQAEYPELRMVVPGHGEPGGPELLAHTAALLAAELGPQPPVEPVTDAHREACAGLGPHWLQIAAWEPGPPAQLHIGVGSVEVMGGYLDFRPMDELEAAEALHEDPAIVGAWLAALGATGAAQAQFFVLRGDDGGFHGGMGIPLRADLAFRHEQGTLVCASDHGAAPASTLQSHLGCAPIPGEDEGWWWCPLQE